MLLISKKYDKQHLCALFHTTLYLILEHFTFINIDTSEIIHEYGDEISVIHGKVLFFEKFDKLVTTGQAMYL